MHGIRLLDSTPGWRQESVLGTEHCLGHEVGSGVLLVPHLGRLAEVHVILAEVVERPLDQQTLVLILLYQTMPQLVL